MADEVLENAEPVEPAESADVTEEQAVPEEGTVSETSLPGVPLAPPKPRSNIFTLLLIISFILIVLAIYLTAYELNKFYGVTFGGILSPPSAASENSDVVK
jgi:hypothetical protein